MNALRRTGTVAAGAALLGLVVAAGPADAAAKKGPKLGDWTCAITSTATTPTLTLAKGNKYTVDGADKGKYVYKTGQKKLKFKTGAWADTYYATYDASTTTLTLHTVADDTEDGGCLQLS